MAMNACNNTITVNSKARCTFRKTEAESNFVMNRKASNEFSATTQDNCANNADHLCSCHQASCACDAGHAQSLCNFSLRTRPQHIQCFFCLKACMAHITFAACRSSTPPPFTVSISTTRLPTQLTLLLIALLQGRSSLLTSISRPLMFKPSLPWCWRYQSMQGHLRHPLFNSLSNTPMARSRLSTSAINSSSETAIKNQLLPSTRSEWRPSTHLWQWNQTTLRCQSQMTGLLQPDSSPPKPHL